MRGIRPRCGSAATTNTTTRPLNEPKGRRRGRGPGSPPARRDPTPGLTRLVLRHRLIVAVFWLAAAAARYATISHTTARLSANFSLPGEPGYETDAGSWRYITMAVPPHPPW